MGILQVSVHRPMRIYVVLALVISSVLPAKRVLTCCERHGMCFVGITDVAFALAALHKLYCHILLFLTDDTSGAGSVSCAADMSCKTASHALE